MVEAAAQPSSHSTSTLSAVVRAERSRCERGAASAAAVDRARGWGWRRYVARTAFSPNAAMKIPNGDMHAAPGGLLV